MRAEGKKLSKTYSWGKPRKKENKYLAKIRRQKSLK